MRPLFAQLPVAFGVGVRLAASLAELVDSTSCIHAIIVIAELVESTSCTCRVGRRMGTLVAAAAAWVDAWPRLAKKPVSELMCQMLAQRAHWILEC